MTWRHIGLLPERPLAELACHLCEHIGFLQPLLCELPDSAASPGAQVRHLCACSCFFPAMHAAAACARAHQGRCG